MHHICSTQIFLTKSYISIEGSWLSTNHFGKAYVCEHEKDWYLAKYWQFTLWLQRRFIELLNHILITAYRHAKSRGNFTSAFARFLSLRALAYSLDDIDFVPRHLDNDVNIVWGEMSTSCWLKFIIFELRIDRWGVKSLATTQKEKSDGDFWKKNLIKVSLRLKVHFYKRIATLSMRLYKYLP
jgi:hypothetical protein